MHLQYVEPQLLVRVIDEAISGNSNAQVAWEAIRMSLAEEREPTLDELGLFGEAVETAVVESSVARTYGREVGEEVLIVDLRNVI